MMKRIFTFLLIMLIASSGLSHAQKNVKITITGTVVDAANKPISNAMVMIDGQKTSTVTDAKGAYKIKVKPGVSRIGIFTFGQGIMEEDIAGRNEINFNFGGKPQEETVTTTGNDAVDVGYAVKKEKDVTVPVDRIDGTDKKYASYKSVYEMIQREVSGVKISGGSIIIQDSKNLWGSIPALLVLDGVYVEDFSDVQPTTVKSIEVLKGASAAMYGSRGYGGVVIVKTKIQDQ